MLKTLLLFYLILINSLVHAVGPESEVPTSKTPVKRIVVLEFSLLDSMKLLGLKPVGVGTSGFSYEGTDPDYLRSIIEHTPSVGAREAPNIEAIAQLKPDLIIADVDFNQNIKPQLEKLAPTILLKGIFGSPEQQITNLKIIAKATNTNTQVSAIIAHYQKDFAKAKEAAAKGGKSTVLIGFPTANNSFNALSNNSITQNTSSQLFELSLEGLLVKNPDQIVILTTNNDLSAYQNLRRNPLWQKLNAEKNHKVYFADRNIWGKSHGLEALELMYKQGIQSGFFTNQQSTH
jgi:iron complex transport system substrate-binding protein